MKSSVNQACNICTVSDFKFSYSVKARTPHHYLCYGIVKQVYFLTNFWADKILSTLQTRNIL